MKIQKSVFILMGLLSIFNSNGRTETWWVASDGTGEAPHVQAAIDSCAPGDTVVALPGIYAGTGNRDIDFLGKSIVVIAQCRVDTTIADSSIIDCEGSYLDLHRGFYFHSGETSASVLEGFVIQNGWQLSGGGICCDLSSSPTITHNSIRNCIASSGGGGIACIDASNPVIHKNHIFNNTDDLFGFGGGIYCYYSSPKIIDNVINSNTIRTGRGGGFFCEYSNPLISGNIIYDNMVTDLYGGGIYCNACTLQITGNTITSNHTNGDGGGIYLTETICEIRENTISWNGAEYGGGILCSGGMVNIRNCTIHSNQSTHSGGGIYGGAIIYNCIVTSNSSGYFPCGGICGTSEVHCCDVYQNIGGNYDGIDLTGLNGNISVDPLFCYPGSDIYTLRSDSPCLPGNHPDGYPCGLIGAHGWGCPTEEPWIATIEDIKNDQGRQVSIKWHRSEWDTTGSAQPVYNYELYRRIDDLPAQVLAVETDEQAHLSQDGDRTIAMYPPGEWHYLFSIPAHGEDEYYAVAPTLEDSCMYNDSTLAGDPLFLSIFFIRAATSVPTNYFDSAPDSGYSVDNLAPAPPEGLHFESCCDILQWNDNGEPDLGWYNIYGRTDMEDGEIALLGTAEISEFDIQSTIGTGYHHWGVTAVDRNGNESDPRMIEWLPTGDDPPTPHAYALQQSYPNPFNPSTTIGFSLPEKTHVRIAIYTATGERVKTLINGILPTGSHRIVWNGTDENGRDVASGVYFYHLKTSGFSQSKKAILLR